MNTQKNDLKQMILPPKETDVEMVGGFSETLALPKNEPLIPAGFDVTQKSNGN